MLYCKVSQNSKVHIIQEKDISFEYSYKGYVFPICGLTAGPKIDATEEEYHKNGCKGCKKALTRRAIARLKYGV